MKRFLATCIDLSVCLGILATAGIVRVLFISTLMYAGACSRQSETDEQIGERTGEKRFETGPPDRIVYQGFYVGMSWKDAERELARLGETQREVISEGEGVRQLVVRCPSITLEIVLDLPKNQIEEISFGLHAAPLTWGQKKGGSIFGPISLASELHWVGINLLVLSASKGSIQRQY
jgi:hypothetical protein